MDVSETAKQDFYTLHVPVCEQYFANGILHHNSGKTFLLCYAILKRALMAPGSRHLIARLNKIDVRKAVMLDTWPKVCRLVCPQIRIVVNKTDQIAYLPNGSEVWFAGLDDKDAVEKILGQEFATTYINESSQVPYETVVILRTRLAQNVTRLDGQQLKLKGYYDLNPTGRQHWTYREFIEGVRPDNPKISLKPGMRTWAAMNPADNPHLPKAYLDILEEMPDRYRKRFKDGVYLDEIPGTLWPWHIIDGFRIDLDKLPKMARIVIAVDPSGSDGTGGDSQGVIVAAKGVDGHYYILRDLSCRLAPNGWGTVVSTAALEYEADCVVAEVNFGGAMVEAVIMNVNPNVRYKAVTASRGKHIRAEPIAALYERGVVHHVGTFAEVEGQMGMMTTAGYQGDGSPDRLDALVWALTELAGIVPGQGLMDMYRTLSEEALTYGVEPEPEESEMVWVSGPPGIGQVQGNAGRVYFLNDGVNGFKMHPADAGAMLGQMGWARM